MRGTERSSSRGGTPPRSWLAAMTLLMVLGIGLIALHHHSLAFSHRKLATAGAAPKLKKETSSPKTRKHYAQQLKMNFVDQQDHNPSQYGQDLPSFAHDFSDYFVGAVIDRSPLLSSNKGAAGNSNKGAAGSSNINIDLNLVVFMLGQKVVRESYLVDAISTDMEVLNLWGEASTKWRIAKDAYPRRDSKNSTKKFSPPQLNCLMYNNDNIHTQPYQTHAQFVYIDSHKGMSEDDQSPYPQNLAILRCKIKGAKTIFSSGTYKSNRRLFVDIVKRNRKAHTFQTKSNGPVNLTDPNALVMSFSVPWKTRYE